MYFSSHTIREFEHVKRRMDLYITIKKASIVHQTCPKQNYTIWTLKMEYNIRFVNVEGIIKDKKNNIFAYKSDFNTTMIF